METYKVYEEELERIETKYSDIINDINCAYRKAIRELGLRKNVLPTEYILPQKYIDRLMEDQSFKQCWERKQVNFSIPDRFDGTVVVNNICTPNIGGVPVTLGLEVKVIVTKVAKRNRGKVIKRSRR